MAGGLREEADNCTFAPNMNKTSMKLVEKMKHKGYESEVSRTRSSSVPASQRSTAKERFAAFVDSLDTKGKCSNNQDRRGRSRGRSSSPAPGSNNSRRERPSSAPPGRPAWGVRSLTSEAIFNKYDSMETLALRSMKSAARTR